MKQILLISLLLFSYSSYAQDTIRIKLQGNFGAKSSLWTSTANNIYYTNIAGNVGIGTVLPQAKLDVNGNIFTNGKVAIGTNDLLQIGNYSLAVNGDAIFNKVRVKLYTSWPDYVFHKDYQLRPLKDLEIFINTYNHLPEIPPAADAMDKGIDLGGIQTILLKKIEELTLYMIEQNKQTVKLQKRIDDQNHKIQEQQTRILELERKN